MRSKMRFYGIWHAYILLGNGKNLLVQGVALGNFKALKKVLACSFLSGKYFPFLHFFFRQKSLDPFFSLGKSWLSLSSHVPINFACSLRFHFRAFFSSLGLIMPLSWHKLVEYAHPRFQYINFSKDSKCASNGMRHCYILEKSVFGPLRPISAYFGLFWA